MPDYSVKKCAIRPELKGLWDGSVWGGVAPLDVACFLRDSSDSRPKTQAKLLVDDSGIYGIFTVRERYIRCVATEFQGEVWQDSCVEFFFQPEGADGYFNFEMNCGGTLLAHYNKLDGSGVVNLTAEEGRAVQIYHSLPSVTDPEIAEETPWVLEFAIPFSVLSGYTNLGSVEGRVWRANLFKCAETCSHPHWASWSPVTEQEEPSFHQVDCFGTIHFDGINL